ncbi:hypothetical protein QH494_12445 [Sphingomonas sp. AR_OL41]|uniref:hypothetical protein n=1 Tax=Sphingomonas sp. AR_OL41 TaxID=3042729 RepID=UPI0024812688|nr:hypothetical protein [Sphingomonas sp. AR_OL41]MDH7972988.1 hypothetical protein [Sphingomonas sp. AR_OL41]
MVGRDREQHRGARHDLRDLERAFELGQFKLIGRCTRLCVAAGLDGRFCCGLGGRTIRVREKAAVKAEAVNQRRANLADCDDLPDRRVRLGHLVQHAIDCGNKVDERATDEHRAARREMTSLYCRLVDRQPHLAKRRGSLALGDDQRTLGAAGSQLIEKTRYPADPPTGQLP